MVLSIIPFLRIASLPTADRDDFKERDYFFKEDLIMDCMSCHSGEQKPHDEVTRFMYKLTRQDGMETIYERFARQQLRRYPFLLAKP